MYLHTSLEELTWGITLSWKISASMRFGIQVGPQICTLVTRHQESLTEPIPERGQWCLIPSNFLSLTYSCKHPLGLVLLASWSHKSAWPSLAAQKLGQVLHTGLMSGGSIIYWCHCFPIMFSRDKGAAKQIPAEGLVTDSLVWLLSLL